MRWKSYSSARAGRKKQWHKWFAWYPVVIFKEYPGYIVCRHYAWLEQVERKGTYSYGYWNYDYREKGI